MKRKIAIGFTALFTALLAFVSTAHPASAHEIRQVGNYTFVVGFLDEPAFANLKNSLDLTICNGKTCNYTVKDGQRILANPVEKAEDALEAEVTMGASPSLALPLKPRYANPGKYASYFMPTVTGAYTFHIFGTLGGSNIDERFTSSPNGFSEVGALNAYPVGQSKVQGQDAASTLQSQIKQAHDSANMAMTFGLVGMIVGVLGLGAAGFVLVRTSKPAAVSSAKDPVDSLRG